VLSVWSRIENVLLARTGSHHKMQVVRLKTAEGIKIVGELFNFNFSYQEVIFHVKLFMYT